ncbi:MAG: TlpA family protein disulfide reductase [Planctomycetes bacterium]|nr:TlpA family protein disulfide reductase [Planctomycetota bacterium]
MNQESVLRSLALAVLLLAPVRARAFTPQDVGKAQKPDVVGPRPVAVPDPEGEALTNEFGSKAKQWNERRMLLSRGGKTPDPRELGAHPALEFKARFQALLEKGSGWAQVWWIDNLSYLVPENDPAGRKRAFLENYDKLVERNASQQYMMFVLGNVRAHRELLGAATIDDMLARLIAASTNPEIQARAAHMRAAFHAPRDPAADPERQEETMEMHRVVVATWPKTLAAQESAGALLPLVEAEFERTLREWITAVLKLHTQSVPPEDWPTPPIESIQPQMLQLARAGLPGAVRWNNRFYNSYKSSEAQGRGPLLAHLANALGTSYPVGNAQIADVRMGIVEILLRAYPNEAFVERLLDGLIEDTTDIDASLAERAFAPLLESQDAHRRAIGCHLIARVYLQALDWPTALKALEWSERLARTAPDDGLVAPTKMGCEPILKLLPGQPGPDFAVVDLEKQPFHLSDYKGQVVLLVFYNSFLDQGFADVPLWREFQARNAQRPFTVLGVNAGTAEPEAFRSKAAKLGIAWRNGLLCLGSADALNLWCVRKFPAVVVLDADGIIRGRDLPWAETKALLEAELTKREAQKR